jgi:hypothetical protein
MRIFVLCAASLALLATAGPAAAKDPEVASAAPAGSAAPATCDAKYYDSLVGKNVGATHDIDPTTQYRVLPQGAAPGTPQPKRMTVTVDRKNQIVEVACG